MICEIREGGREVVLHHPTLLDVLTMLTLLFMKDKEVEAWTTNVKRGWPVAMLVGLRVEAGHMVHRQYFESVEAARRAAERWKI